MTKRLREFLFTTFCTLIPVACFCGAVTSTIAWYAYSSSASMSYHGTSISITNLLQIGIKTDLDLSEYGLKTDTGVAWADPGAGLVPDQISAYFKATGYAYEMLTPLTSGEYKNNDDLHLTGAPAYGILYNDDPAEKASYCVLPLAFRTYKTSGAYLPNEKVWLFDSSVLCKEYKDLSQGIRLHFKNEDEQFIVNSSSNTKGYTVLGGLQDLNVDGFYDSDIDNDELIYGHFTGTPTLTYNENDTGLVDINKTGQTEQSTFLSRHRGKTNIVESYEDLVFPTAEYEGMGTVAPVKGTGGVLEDGKPVCVTGIDGIGYVDMTMWIEGWDHSVYDNAAGYKFLMNLTFIVNSN